MTMKPKPRVVVIGGGFAGLETAFYLRHKLGRKVDIQLISNDKNFVFKPDIIYIPFGGDPKRFLTPLGPPTKRKRINFLYGRARSIDTDDHVVSTEYHDYHYDYLVIASGAAVRPGEIPGLSKHAETLWTSGGMLKLKRAYEQLALEAEKGEKKRLLFVVPPNNRCSGPLYEMGFMTDTWLRRKNARDPVHMTWVTYEDGFIQSLGPRLDTVVKEEFEERGIAGHKGMVLTGVEPGKCHFLNGDTFPYDILVSFPPQIAHETFEGLPTDERGFISVDPDSRRVKGLDRVFAVGDAADFPMKRAFLALLQADAAADHIVADIEGRKPEVPFEPVCVCVLEEMNKATFAQVPLKYTGDPANPVEVDVNDEHYKVGVSPLWRLGKRALGFYLPWKFGAGEPFHAGFGWETMELGLKVMTRTLAD